MKLIAMLFIYLAITSCGKYTVGVISVAPTSAGKGYFSYIINGEDIKIEGKAMGNEFFVGKVFTTGVVRKIEKSRFPQVPNHRIKERNIFAFTQLVGNKGKLMDCFILQNSPRNFAAGGIGRCYVNDKKIIDIIVERAPWAFLMWNQDLM